MTPVFARCFAVFLVVFAGATVSVPYARAEQAYDVYYHWDDDPDSVRDYARKVILKGKSSINTPVREIMTEKVLFVGPNQTVADCMALMTHQRVRHLPVLEGDRVVGQVSRRDLLGAAADLLRPETPSYNSETLYLSSVSDTKPPLLQ